jgi:hypothetical protein
MGDEFPFEVHAPEYFTPPNAFAMICLRVALPWHARRPEDFMNFRQKFATAVTLASTLLGATAAQASDQYSFPSPSGALIASSTATFVQLPGSDVSAGPLSPPGTGSQISALSSPGMDTTAIPRLPPPPAGSPNYRDRVERNNGGDAAAYALLTSGLSSASYANYAADYYRLFAPGHAVAAWTDRVAGIVEAGYGGAVDSWTAGAYYLSRLHGPARRSESAPDLTLLPKFRPHPELEQNPGFSKQVN